MVCAGVSLVQQQKQEYTGIPPPAPQKTVPFLLDLYQYIYTHCCFMHLLHLYLDTDGCKLSRCVEKLEACKKNIPHRCIKL